MKLKIELETKMISVDGKSLGHIYLNLSKDVIFGLRAQGENNTIFAMPGVEFLYLIDGSIEDVKNNINKQIEEITINEAKISKSA